MSEMVLVDREELAKVLVALELVLDATTFTEQIKWSILLCDRLSSFSLHWLRPPWH